LHSSFGNQSSGSNQVLFIIFLSFIVSSLFLFCLKKKSSKKKVWKKNVAF
jgi:hypothetical protein